MSLTQGLGSPRTPLRRFLDRELSAGVRPVRATYRAQLPTAPLVLPGQGVGFEAGTVGTAIDQRLRLAFTDIAAVDGATAVGVGFMQDTAQAFGPGPAWDAIAAVGEGLVERMRQVIPSLALADRRLPLMRTHEEEDQLARLLLAGAWYALNCRNAIAFPLTPLCKAAFADPSAFTLERLLELPHPDLVADVLTQVRVAEDGPLDVLRAQTDPAACLPGPTFDGSTHMPGDADLIADGLLIDFKSTKRVHIISLPMILQLLGYALMDFTDRYRIDRVGVYLTRARALISWPIEDYLDLLGARRRDLAELRAAFATLLTYAGCRADDDPLPEQQRGVDQLLAELAPTIPADCCRVCAQPLHQPMIGVRARLYCSAFCRGRSASLRYHGWL